MLDLLEEILVREPARFQDPRLAHIIRERIEQQSGGRIHGLRVDVAAGRVIVHGSTSAFYLRQLALLAALEVLGSSDPDLVDLDIQVVS